MKMPGSVVHAQTADAQMHAQARAVRTGMTGAGSVVLVETRSDVRATAVQCSRVDAFSSTRVRSEEQAPVRGSREPRALAVYACCLALRLSW